MFLHKISQHQPTVYILHSRRITTPDQALMRRFRFRQGIFDVRIWESRQHISGRKAWIETYRDAMYNIPFAYNPWEIINTYKFLFKIPDIDRHVVKHHFKKEIKRWESLESMPFKDGLKMAMK